MSLPWFKVDTMGPIPSISRGGWRSKPPEWVMRHEFAAIVAAGMVSDWSLTQIADRWCCGRKQAKRVIQEWFHQADRIDWDESSKGFETPWCLQAVSRQHPWLAPVMPMRVESQVPGKNDESREVARPVAPQMPRKCPANAPLTRAILTEDEDKKEIEKTSLSDSDKPKPDNMNLGDIWKKLYATRKKYIPSTRVKGFSPDRSAMLKRRLEDLRRASKREGPLNGIDPVEALFIGAEWMHTSDAPQADGARSTGDAITTLLRTKCVSYCEQAIEDDRAVMPGSPVDRHPDGRIKAPDWESEFRRKLEDAPPTKEELAMADELRLQREEEQSNNVVSIFSGDHQ